MDTPNSLPEIASRYRSKVTVVPNGGGPGQRVVEANPQRIFLRIIDVTGFATGVIFRPIPMPDPPPSINTVENPLEVKFADAPSGVVSDWYAWGNAWGVVIVWEEIKTGV